MGTTITFGVLLGFVTPPGDDNWCSGSFVDASFRGRPRPGCQKQSHITWLYFHSK